MKTTFIDTQFVVALVNQRDQFHHCALELADLYEGERFLTTDAVLLEIGNALARNFKQQAVEILKQFLSSDDVDVVHLTPTLFDEAFALYQTHQDKSWGLIDCLSFVVMTQNGIDEALTCDQHFAQAGFHPLMQN